ncbi:MAG: putative metal-dependent hydrolase [Bryobacteraceae bacterium]|nr:putative metal-dependent hydrolase [Bryobacteraceae bacterium]
MDPRYPIGTFTYSRPRRAEWLDDIEQLPSKMREAVDGLNDPQLDTPYRDGGWTVRQVVHHTADSHVNSYARFRLALTEEEPVIKPYEEQLWAELADAKSDPVEVSLTLLDALHKR